MKSSIALLALLSGLALSSPVQNQQLEKDVAAPAAPAANDIYNKDATLGEDKRGLGVGLPPQFCVKGCCLFFGDGTCSRCCNLINVVGSWSLLDGKSDISNADIFLQ